jgi:hypothetical protein
VRRSRRPKQNGSMGWHAPLPASLAVAASLGLRALHWHALHPTRRRRGRAVCACAAATRQTQQPKGRAVGGAPRHARFSRGITTRGARGRAFGGGSARRSAA